VYGASKSGESGSGNWTPTGSSPPICSTSHATRPPAKPQLVVF
jgi:hypothetical protein